MMVCNPVLAIAIRSEPSSAMVAITLPGNNSGPLTSEVVEDNGNL